MQCPGLGSLLPGKEKGKLQVHQLPSLVLLGQAHALEAAAEGVVPAENIHSAVEPGGGHLFGSGTCFIQGFLERLFSFHLHWLGIKGKKKIQLPGGQRKTDTAFGTPPHAAATSFPLQLTSRPGMGNRNWQISPLLC